MKTMLKILSVLCLTVLLSSCGTARKADRQQEKTQVQQDTLPPTHPPVVVPHTWREA